MIGFLVALVCGALAMLIMWTSSDRREPDTHCGVHRRGHPVYAGHHRKASAQDQLQSALTEDTMTLWVKHSK